MASPVSVEQVEQVMHTLAGLGLLDVPTYNVLARVVAKQRPLPSDARVLKMAFGKLAAIARTAQVIGEA